MNSNPKGAISMTSREKIVAVLNRTNAGKPGYWTGNPHEDTFRIYFRELGISTAEELYTLLGDDCRWFPADGCYTRDGSHTIFPFFNKEKRTTLSEGGVFEGDDVTVADVEAFDWPDVKYL